MSLHDVATAENHHAATWVEINTLNHLLRLVNNEPVQVQNRDSAVGLSFLEHRKSSFCKVIKKWMLTQNPFAGPSDNSSFRSFMRLEKS